MWAMIIEVTWVKKLMQHQITHAGFEPATSQGGNSNLVFPTLPGQAISYF